jgi:hypothetical protein
MKNYVKQTISQVRKIIKVSGVWRGLLVGNKVNQFHFENGWHLAHFYEFHSVEELEFCKANTMYYLDRSLGNNIAFYIIQE